MRRKLAAVVVAVVAGLWLADLAVVTIWDGSFELSVTVQADTGPLRSLTCEAFAGRDDAEFAAERGLPPQSGWSAARDPFDGRALVVSVPCGGRKSLFGWELRRSQFRYLAVVGRTEGGVRVRAVAEIPDAGPGRAVVVRPH